VSFLAQGRAKKHPLPTLSAVTLAVGVLALAGCGSSSNTTSSTTPATTASTASTPTTSSTPATTTSSSTAPSGALTIEANREGQLSYNKTSLTAPKAGEVSIDFTNASPLGHNLTVESSAGKVIGATPTFQGGSKTLTLDLKAGTYKFFCSVPGHRQAGMEGTLTVQ
jgi:uncharacterized cupredoxin-like copper-binding protein